VEVAVGGRGAAPGVVEELDRDRVVAGGPVAPLRVRVSDCPTAWEAEAVKVPPIRTPSTLTVYSAGPW